MKTLVYSVILLLVSTSFAFAEQSFEYEPTVVKLRGKLISAPGETPLGKKIQYPALQLYSPISVEGTEDFPAEKGVMLLHMVLESKMMKIYKKNKGKSVLVTGSLFHSDNGNHQTDVLITPSAITLQ